MEDMLRYLDEIVDPTIKDFEEHPTSVRHGFLACVAAFHAIDYLAFPKKRSSHLRQRFRQQSPDFHMVDSVAHAFKHVVAGDRARPDLMAHQVIPRPPSFSGLMVAGLSSVGDTHGGVTLAHDTSIELLGVLKRAVMFLRSLSDPTASVTSSAPSAQ